MAKRQSALKVRPLDPFRLRPITDRVFALDLIRALSWKHAATPLPLECVCLLLKPANLDPAVRCVCDRSGVAR